VQLNGKHALVTGGGRGIGQACALALARAGASVTVVGRNRMNIEAVAAQVDGRALVADLADRAETDRMLAQAGKVDILVNNAGIAESAPLDKTTDELWERVIELDATSPFRVIRALAPAMVAAKWGRIINIASNAGVSGYGYTAAYCAAKHAMVGFTRALAIDLARTGVTINALCPGWVATDMAAEAVARIAA
jgi:NAD(P)-dependent dehydrogenase (short-subunit alcohol dehydrogenase family)